MDGIKGWLARQDEVDALIAHVAALNAAAIQAADELAIAKSQVSAALDVNEVMQDQNIELRGQVASLTRQLGDAVKALEEYKKSHPDVVKPPSPPTGWLPFGVGINEKNLSADKPIQYTYAQLETTAGKKFSYIREYFTLPSAGIATSSVTWCEKHLKEGRVPVISFKLPGNDWAGAAAGKYDAAVKATIDALEKLAAKYDNRIVVAFHHEPDNGDGSVVVFKQMTSHLLPTVKRAGKIEYWVCETGYEQMQASSEWKLGASYVAGIDGYSWDPYQWYGATTSKLSDQRKDYLVVFAAWAASKNIQWGIWETGLTEVAAAKPGTDAWWVDFVDDCQALGATHCIYWNNSKKYDWRITTTKPADKHAQMVTVLKKWGA